MQVGSRLRDNLGPGARDGFFLLGDIQDYSGFRGAWGMANEHLLHLVWLRDIQNYMEQIHCLYIFILVIYDREEMYYVVHYITRRLYVYIL